MGPWRHLPVFVSQCAVFIFAADAEVAGGAGGKPVLDLTGVVLGTRAMCHVVDIGPHADDPLAQSDAISAGAGAAFAGDVDTGVTDTVEDGLDRAAGWHPLCPSATSTARAALLRRNALRAISADATTPAPLRSFRRSIRS